MICLRPLTTSDEEDIKGSKRMQQLTDQEHDTRANRKPTKRCEMIQIFIQCDSVFEKSIGNTQVNMHSSTAVLKFTYQADTCSPSWIFNSQRKSILLGLLGKLILTAFRHTKRFI